MPRRLFAGLVVSLLVVLGAASAAAVPSPRLIASGPTSVSGTDATEVFTIADRTVRQVRYQDKGTLVYSFVLTNHGPLPVTVTGLAPLDQEPRLFHYLRVTDADGDRSFTIDPGGRTVVRLSMLMHSCETLSARAGSFATEANLQTSRAGLLHSAVTVTFPEEVHTGSPREAFCPSSTATSRPPG